MMPSPVTPSSFSTFRRFFPSVGIKWGGSMNGGSMNGRHFRSTGTLSPTRQVREAQSRGFSYSSKQQRQQQRQQQRLALNSVGKKKIHGGTNGRRYSHHQQHIPNYVYFVGGIPFVGGIYLYFRFQDFVPLTGRRRWLATQPETERIFGDEKYRLLLAQYRNNILPKQHPATVKIDRIGKRIFSAARKFADENDLSSFDRNNVTFTVVNSDQANVFILPGNHVFFLTGMFKYARTEDEIGGILGHEMAHNLARHQGERISSSVVVSIIGAFSLLIDPSGSLLYFFAPAVRLFGQLPNSRIQESEADQIGMRLAAEACYDPEALSHVCRRTDKAGRDGNLANKPPEFLSSHPSDESRIKDMQKWLLEDRKIFNMYDGKRCREFRRQVNNPTNNRIFHHSHSREHEAPDGMPC
mmetsp:Transcript_7401/g.15875  ORF Transcript_7401/g.15875 Transcript_7401/m.15875 type:complete len:411 (-) Transcript_7401:1506-2738(-)